MPLHACLSLYLSICPPSIYLSIIYYNKYFIYIYIYTPIYIYIYIPVYINVNAYERCRACVFLLFVVLFPTLPSNSIVQ